MSGTHAEPSGDSRRRFDPSAVLAVVLVVLCAAALALTRPTGWSIATSEDPGPTPTALRDATVTCPAPISRPIEGGVTTLTEGGGGTVRLTGDGLGGEDGEAEVSAGKLTDLPRTDAPLGLRLTGDGAAGLVAGRATISPLAVAGCEVPTGERWFTGLGAGPQHTSSVDLTNPNPGPAVIDLELYDTDGALDLPRLRGVSVPGGSSRTIRLDEVTPTLSELAMHTRVTRGEVAVSVRDRTAAEVEQDGEEEYLTGQESAAETVTLLGLTDGNGRRLSVLNAADRQLDVEVRLVTEDAVISTERAPDIDLAPGAVTSTGLTKLLNSDVAEDAIGIQVRADGPIAASLRTLRDGDPVVTSPVPALSEPAGVVLPVASRVRDKQLALTGLGGRRGRVVVAAYAAGGDELERTRVPLAPGASTEIGLPDRTALVRLTPTRVRPGAAVVLTGPTGGSTLPVVPGPGRGLVPTVAPGLR